MSGVISHILVISNKLAFIYEQKYKIPTYLIRKYRKNVLKSSMYSRACFRINIKRTI